MSLPHITVLSKKKSYKRELSKQILKYVMKIRQLICLTRKMFVQHTKIDANTN